MSRDELKNNNHLTKLEKMVTRAIRRYYRIHRTPSVDRVADILHIKSILADADLVDAQKHIAIAHYMESITVGLLGRSKLRDFVLEALHKVPLEQLIDELLAHHITELRTKDIRINALQPLKDNESHQLLLSAKTADINELQKINEQLTQKSERLVKINHQLIEKYQTLKQKNSVLCKKYGESCGGSLETLSQLSYQADERFIVGQSIISEHHEEALGERSLSLGSETIPVFKLNRSASEKKFSNTPVLSPPTV